jgi:hypothetical protein
VLIPHASWLLLGVIFFTSRPSELAGGVVEGGYRGGKTDRRANVPPKLFKKIWKTNTT